MRAVREIRPPGVYPAADEPRAEPLTVADTRIAGFVGLAARGPLDEPRAARRAGTSSSTSTVTLPTRATSARAVEGFFLNGGQRCYVVRVAHRAPRRRRAARARARVVRRARRQGRLGQADLRVRALNEGRWGNDIWVRFAQTTAAQTLLTLDLDVGVGRGARQQRRAASSAARWCASTIARTRTTSILTEVDDRTHPLGAATPIVRRYRAAGPTLPRGARVRGVRVAEGSARGVPRAAAVAAVAPLRAAHHQRGVAAHPGRGPAVGVAAAAQPAARPRRRPS